MKLGSERNILRAAVTLPYDYTFPILVQMFSMQLFEHRTRMAKKEYIENNVKMEDIMKRILLLIVLLLALTSSVVAKGPADRVFITTPNGQRVTVTDAELTKSISMAALEAFFNPHIAEPVVLGEGYELARMMAIGNNQYRIFDRVRFYPVGDRGYVYYVGIENGTSEYDGKWFEATQPGLAAMREIIGSVKPVSLAHFRSVLA